jgi:hypothetical protein
MLPLAKNPGHVGIQNRTSGSEMCTLLWRAAQRVISIALGIISGVAAKLLMMDFQVRHPSATLTAPAVAAEDLQPQLLI